MNPFAVPGNGRTRHGSFSRWLCMTFSVSSLLGVPTAPAGLPDAASRKFVTAGRARAGAASVGARPRPDGQGATL